MPVIKSAAVFLLMLGCSDLRASEFCSGSVSVEVNEIIRNAEVYKGKRIETLGILLTDAKEFTLLKQVEKSKNGILIAQENAETLGASSSGMLEVEDSDYMEDFARLYHQRVGMSAPLDLSKIAYYRQSVRLCGRVVAGARGWRFAIDRSKRLDSFLLVWKVEPSVRHPIDR
jgi:hypothetical protein